MRESSSRHLFNTSFSRNQQTGFLLPSCDEVDFSRLAECLSLGTISDEGISDLETEQKFSGSKKRVKVKGKSVAKYSSRPAKRVKLDGAVSNLKPTVVESAVPIIRHTFEIDFAVADEDQDAPEVQTSVSPHRDFLNVLANKRDERPEEQDEIVFDLGTVYPHAYLNKVHACRDDPLATARLSALPLSSLAILPALEDDIKDADHDFNSHLLRDIFASAHRLQQNKRARLFGPMCIILPKSSSIGQDERTVPITLRIEITISLLETGIFEPLTTFRKKDSEIEEAQRRILTYAFGAASPHANGDKADMPLFLSCLKPAAALPSDKAHEAAQPDELLPKLLPFQRRSVNWLLQREGKNITEDGRIEDIDNFSPQLPLFWEKVSLAYGKVWYFNRISGMLRNEEPPRDDFRGGILAEEPGLGKTLESIALILLNPTVDRNPSISRWDPVGVINVKEVKTTLIVTPASLAQQWVDELKLHAPSLKVLVYEGWTKVPVPITAREAEDKLLQSMREKRGAKIKIKPNEDDFEDDDDIDDMELTDEEKKELKKAAEQLTWCDFVHQYDVCITTYNNLQQDLGVARAPLQRPRREVAKYVDIYRDRSPLVMVEWHRVIMDEVQMVGGGKTEEMVSLIPRLSSFAVSGTPARSSVGDLIHVIRFLRVNAVMDSSKAWMRLQKPAFVTYFKDLFNRIAVRTMKAKVQDELTIPQQSRYVVPIELGKVERHVYEDDFERALNDLGLDSRGVAASSGWQIDVGVLRNWLRRLRGICTHPQVGKLAKQNDRLAKVGSALKSIGEVLEDMKEQNWRKLMDEKKSRVQGLVKRAELTQQSEDPERHNRALETLLDAQKHMDTICVEINDAIAQHDAKGELLKQEAAAAAQRTLDEHNSAEMPNTGAQREGSVAPSDDSAEDGLPKTPAGVEHRHKKNALQSRLREAHIVLHQIQFRLGDVYHIMGDTYSAKEVEAYATAEELRRRLLKTTEQVAIRSIAQIKLVSMKKTTEQDDVKIGHCEQGGLRSEDFLREADRIIDILNEQTDVLFQWRARIIELLTKSLTASEGEDADGEEYARTLDTQGEAEAFLQAYSALLADRRELLVAERTALAAHDARERKIRHTIAAKRAAEDARDGRDMELDEMRPEDEVLQKELTERRKIICNGHDGRAVKSIFVDLQGVAGSIVNENDPEKIIAKRWITKLKSLIKEQMALHEKLEADMAPFRKAFNDRVQYFRQLQEISDTVRDVEWEGDVMDAIAKTHAEEETIKNEINKLSARRRYLQNLADNEDQDEEDNTCILCKCDFVRGFMTQCAHVYCEGCVKVWFSRQEGKACPVCRIIIVPEQLQRITMEEKKIEPSVESSNQTKRYISDALKRAPQSRRVIEYNSIDPGVLEEIRKIDCLGSYGTKIETLVRHLLYLEDVDPGCKSIVFSAWADSLYILERALKENGISYLRIDQKKEKQNAVKLFRTDHRFRVLLLHGERENAGLNVTCASRVFLTESVVQHSFELQAIARIDRLGQTRPTEVYCYYAEDTVERNILDLAAKRGLSLYTKDHAIGTVKVTSFEMDKNSQIDSPAVKNGKKQKGQKGDFIFRADDMLAILFPHLFEEVEYLLPEEAGMDMLNDDFDDGNDGEDGTNEQPVAGPSREVLSRT